MIKTVNCQNVSLNFIGLFLNLRVLNLFNFGSLVILKFLIIVLT